MIQLESAVCGGFAYFKSLDNFGFIIKFDIFFLSLVYYYFDDIVYFIILSLGPISVIMALVVLVTLFTLVKCVGHLDHLDPLFYLGHLGSIGNLRLRGTRCFLAV